MGHIHAECFYYQTSLTCLINCMEHLKRKNISLSDLENDLPSKLLEGQQSKVSEHSHKPNWSHSQFHKCTITILLLYYLLQLPFNISPSAAVVFFFPLFLLGKRGMWKCADSFQDTKHYHCTAVSWLALSPHRGKIQGSNSPVGRVFLCGLYVLPMSLCMGFLQVLRFLPQSSKKTKPQKKHAVD